MTLHPIDPTRAPEATAPMGKTHLRGGCAMLALSGLRVLEIGLYQCKLNNH